MDVMSPEEIQELRDEKSDIPISVILFKADAMKLFDMGDAYHTQLARIAELEAERDEMAKQLVSSSRGEVLTAAYEQGAQDMRETVLHVVAFYDDGKGTPASLSLIAAAIRTAPLPAKSD